MADKRLTEAQFSMQCAFIAKNAAAWAGDILTLPENYNRKADAKTVARFTDEMRARLDRLDEWAGRSNAQIPGPFAIGERVRKVGGRYGGPGRIVGISEDLDGQGYRLYQVAMHVAGGYGEFVHVFPAAALRPDPQALGLAAVDSTLITTGGGK
ncbi:hypothetical protein [Shinella pollutisoli]|uniref:Uncharacterized protein n=1 Tax=Shinella pollutisoli TaxID=2250594 RepID=A0ABV7DJ25_9HYPH|nr:hypothetical protein [Shinella pollutisoli]